MRTILTVIAVMLLLIGTTQAQERVERGNRGERQGRGVLGNFDPAQIVERMFEQDENSDGKLAKDEVSERMAGMFDRADSDKDGFVTKEELKTMFAARMSQRGGGDRVERGPVRGGPGGPGGPRGMAGMLRMLPIMVALDADKNGELSTEEIENAVAALKTLDKDNDGKISTEEMMPDMSQMMRRGGERDRQRPERPRRPALDDDKDKENDK